MLSVDLQKSMEPAINNTESSQPLPLFRPEALAAREKLQGEILSIRPYSSSAFLVLAAGIMACALGFLLFAQYEPRATVSGSISSVTRDTARQKSASSTGTFYVPGKYIQNIHPGSRLTVRWQLSSHRASLQGVVGGITPLQNSAAGVASPDLAIPGPVYKVVVDISLNSLPGAVDRLHPGAKLQAEFPLERRPLLRWLIGAAAL